MINVMVSGRVAGKTASAIAWVRQGQRVSGSYPGWSRVLVVPDYAQRVRLQHELWREIEDFDHRVYDFRTWSDARGVDPATEVLIDNAEMLLSRIPGRLTAITMTGELWQPEPTFRPDLSDVPE